MGHLRLVHSAPSSVPLGDPCLEAFAAELDYIYQSLRWLGASPEMIDDLAHEVFLGLQRKWPKAGAPKPLRAHLFGLALRVVRRFARRAGGRHEVCRSGDDLARQRSRGDSTIAGQNGLPDRMDVLQVALAHVPLLRRSVLVLHEMDGLSIPEIAIALSMPKWAVRWRLRWGRRDLTTAVRDLTSGDLRS